MTNCPLRVAARHACFLYSNVHSCGARKRLQCIGLGFLAISNGKKKLDQFCGVRNNFLCPVKIGQPILSLLLTRIYLIFNIMLRCSNPSIMKGSDVA